MIELRDVWFSYNSGKPIIHGVNLKLSNEITIIIGPNGAGKTTLLKIIACLYKPDKGDVLIDGVNFWKLKSKEKLIMRRKIVYVHENPVLFKGTVMDNVTYPLIIRGHSLEKAREKALKLLKSLKLDYLTDRKRNELSAGESQLVAIARAIISGAKYIVLDEPTSNLDLEHRIVLENIIRAIVKSGKQVIIATHDRLFALKLNTEK